MWKAFRFRVLSVFDVEENRKHVFRVSIEFLVLIYDPSITNAVL